MSFGFRHFLFDEDNGMHRVPGRVVNGLVHGYDYLPQYAGKQARVASVILEVDAKRPVRIEKIEGEIWRFDEKGGVRKSLLQGAALAMQSMDYSFLPPEPTTSVINIGPKRARQRLKDEFRWEPSPSEINRMIRTIWPDTAAGKREKVTTLAGITRPRPPMTDEARRAHRELTDPVNAIRSIIDDLDIPSLKALIALAKDDAEGDAPSYRALWSGIAAAAEHELTVKKAWKSGRGKWFAIASHGQLQEYGRHKFNMYEDIDFIECASKSEAEKAARDLLRKHADKFSATSNIEVQIRPAIDWEPPTLAD